MKLFLTLFALGFVYLNGQEAIYIKNIDYYVIDECTDLGMGLGSQQCYCVDPESSSGDHLGAIHCYGYESKDCMGDLDYSEIYGGCSTSSEEYYVVEYCQDASDEAAGGDCGYWIDGSLNTWPLNHCMNWNCDNFGPAAKSCIQECENGNIINTYWTDNYNCPPNPDGTNNVNTTTSVFNMSCGAQSCGASLYRYGFDNSFVECQSKSSPFKVQSGKTNCNYLYSQDDGLFSIGQCGTDRTGFYEYGRMYECINANTVALYHYLGDGDCKDDTYKELVATYTSDNYTISCDQNNCGGYYGSYEDCDYENFKTQYDETPAAFKACTKLYSDPWTDEASEPWYDSVYFQGNSIFKDKLLSIFYYHDTTCSDYQFTFYFDPNNFLSTLLSNQYYDAEDRCTQNIKGAGNTKDSLTYSYLNPC